MKKAVLLQLFIIFIFIGCIKKDFPAMPTPAPTAEDQSIDKMVVNPSFTFKTDYNVNVQLTTLDNADNPIPRIRINIYTDFPENGGSLIMSCFTASNGVFTGVLKLPSYADSVVLETDAIGFVNMQKRRINNNSLQCVFGGSHPTPGLSSGYTGPLPITAKGETNNSLVPVIKALGTFNSLGKPNYLTPTNDLVDAAFLADINTALPENKPVPSFHPQYLTQTNQTNLIFQQTAQVWVTFVHEGAGYKNTLCYYKYNPNNPPATAADIDTLFAIFPNTSYINSGGDLVSGNKVEIGTFAPGTAVGWAIIANGYNGSAITNGLGVYYSQSYLNPETNASLKQHCVMLNDVNRGKVLLSFEDINRQNAGCDNDFNDAIFYVTANPIQAILATNISLPAYTTLDTDQDGVTDNFDDFPNDASRAFNNFYPSENTVGTLAFEDLWPLKGDYDLNDLVVDYNFNTITNAQNQVVQIKAAITTKAIGASNHNGFGIQLPISPSLVSSITGTDLVGNTITRNPNGTEANQSKATIILYEDAFNQLPWPGGGTGVNTTVGAPYVQPKTLNLTINLTTPVNASLLGLPPYNPFIYINRVRANEVHLINQPPTDLANKTILGTQQDNSNPAAGRYYVTAQNLPFAIDVAGPFEHPAEKKVITSTHLKFYQWGTSNGMQYRDWYKPVTNYRNQTNIYTH